MELAKNTNVPVKSLRKALEILDIILFECLDGQGISLSDLARKMGQAANSTHNLLKTMTACGYVSQDDSGKYIAGNKIGMISRINHVLSVSVMQQVQQDMAALVNDISESVVLAMLANGRRWVLTRVEHNQVIGISHPETNVDKFYKVPTGKVLSAWADGNQLREIIEINSLPKQTWDDINDIETLKKKLVVIRKTGYVIQREAGGGTYIISMAVPVLGPAGELLGALGCFAPEFRCDSQKQSRIIAGLIELGKTISHRIG